MTEIKMTEIKWIKEEDDKPPFDIPVFAWHTCDSCRDNKPHMHNCLARGYPVHGPMMATYCDANMTIVNHYRQRGDHSWDHLAVPHWNPVKPSHWMKVESPYAWENNG